MQIFRYDALDSTNDEAKRLVHRGVIETTACVVAREQTAGRGTRGRAWASPRDAGIYLSIAARRPGGDPGAPERFTRAAGVRCAAALAGATGIDVRVKPINDLCVDGRKLAGILTEAAVVGGVFESIVIGLGVNVTRADRPVLADALAPVCLEELVGADRLQAIGIRSIEAALVTALGDALRDARE